jgi:uncharacterized protein YndB with AHSA1/START domain
VTDDAARQARQASEASEASEASRWVRLRRRLDASPERVFRAFADPEELVRWFPERVEGSLAPGTRSVLVWPDQRVWWDVTEAHASNRFAFRWPLGADEGLTTRVTVTIAPAGYGSRLELEDGPFPIDRAGIDAWGAAGEGWGEALMLLRAHLDFSVDLRPRS